MAAGAAETGIKDTSEHDVWASNFEEEFDELVRMAETYKCVAIDTEFPGIVLEADCGAMVSQSTQNYVQLRDNVNLLRCIQLGLTFSDEKGRKAERPTFQFNFSFNLEGEWHAKDAIDLLRHAGLDFNRHGTEGISVEEFGERLTTSGLVLNEDVRWISFHGMYDFGYMLKLLTCKPLPEDTAGFYEQLALFFPWRCDIKYLMRQEFRGGLNGLAAKMGVQRRGATHQGGSDSLLTCDVFHKLPDRAKEEAFEESENDATSSEGSTELEQVALRKRGPLFGLSDDAEDRFIFEKWQNQQAASTSAQSQHGMVIAPSGTVLSSTASAPMGGGDGSRAELPSVSFADPAISYLGNSLGQGGASLAGAGSSSDDQNYSAWAGSVMGGLDPSAAVFEPDGMGGWEGGLTRPQLGSQAWQAQAGDDWGATEWGANNPEAEQLL